MLRLTIAVQIAAIAVFLVTESLAFFLAGTVLLGAASASMWPLVYDLVARTQEPRVRGEATGFLVSEGFIATGSGLFVGALLSEIAPWRAVFVVAAALVIFPLFMQGAAALERAGSAEEPPLVRRRRSRLVFFGLIIFLDYAGMASVAGFYGPYAELTLGISLLSTALLILPAGVAAVGALALAARYSAPHRRLADIAAAGAVSAAGAFALAVAPSPLVACISLIPFGAGLGAASPLIAATILDLSGRERRGMVIGSLMSVEGLGAVLGPAGVATVVSLTSPRGGFNVVGAMFTLFALLAGVGFLKGMTASSADEPAARVAEGALDRGRDGGTER